MKKSVPFYRRWLPIVFLALIALLLHKNSQRGTKPATSQPSSYAQVGPSPSTGHLQVSGQNGRGSDPLLPEHTPSFSARQTAAPVIRHYTAPGARERGMFKSRRYRQPVKKSFSEAARARPAVVWSRPPLDGRVRAQTEELTDEHTLSARRVAWDATAFNPIISLESARMAAPVVEGDPLSVTFYENKTRSEFTHTLMGKIDGEEMSDVIVVVHDGVIYGSIANYKENRHWEYNTLDGEHLIVRELDPTSYTAPCGTPHGHAAGPSETAQAPEGHVHFQAAEADTPDAANPGTEGEEGGDIAADPTPNYVTIDAVVGYGIQARQAEGGVSQIEAKILASVDRMNLAFTNSAIADTELMLLGTIEDPDYVFKGDDNGSMSGELVDLNAAYSTNPELNTVSDFAFDLGADLRSFVIKGADGSAGRAYRPGRSQITARDYMTSTRITWVHENGHNIGCKHAWGDSSGGNSGYNHGWRYKDGNTQYRTVMAYDWGWTRTPYFATPDVTRFSGIVRVGAADGYDATGDSTTDSRFVSGGYSTTDYGAGFDGSNPNLGARNADYIEERAYLAASNDTRSNLSILTPGGGESFTAGVDDITIVYSGVDHTDTVTLDLFRGSNLQANIITDLDHLSGSVTYSLPGSVPGDTNYKIRITRNGSVSTDSATFAVVGNSNTAPTDLSLGSNQITENQATGSPVGTFSTVDAEGGPFTYTLVSGSGSTNNGSFQINGSTLESAEVFDFESKDSYSIRVRTTDPGGLFREESFTINITNTNDAPIIVVDSPASSTASIPADTGLLLKTTASDDNFGGSSLTLTWSKVSGPGTLTWDNIDQEDTGVQFSADGEYILRLTADDGSLNTSTEITVFVNNGIPTSGLFTHFPMDDTAGSSTAAETSGNNYTGTVSGDVNFGTLGGRSNVATFGGGGGDIESASAGQALSGLTAFTASFWYYANASMLNTDGGLIDTLPPGGSSNNVLGDFVVRFDDRGWFSTPSNSSQNHLNISLNTTDGNITYYTAQNTMDSGQWHHFVFVWESGSLPKVYFDGVEDTPTVVGTLSGNTFTSNRISNGAIVLPSSLFFGHQLRDEPNESWQGGMDDVRFYNRALTAAEVALLHQGQPVNEGPDVDAGSLANGVASQSQSLDGTVTDDGNPSASVTTLWTQRSGSGTVTFGNAGLIDTTASADAADTYVLRLQSDDGDIITFDELSWTVIAPSPPDAASGLSATAVSSSAIDLSWTDNSANETGFRVERATSSGGPWTTVTTTAANATSHQDTGRTADTEYFYQIIATNATGDSAASNEASATTRTAQEQYFADSGLAYDVDPGIDTDGDGQTNEQEFWAGTDPDDANSMLEIVSLTVTAAGIVTVEWSSDQTGNTAARQYRIMYTDGPLSGSSTWFELQGNIDASGSGTNTLQDDLSGEGTKQRTYRIEIEGSPQAKSMNVRTARIYLAKNETDSRSFAGAPIVSTLDLSTGITRILSFVALRF